MNSVGIAPGTASCIRIGQIDPAAPAVASLAVNCGERVGATGPDGGSTCQGGGR